MQIATGLKFWGALMLLAVLYAFSVSHLKDVKRPKTSDTLNIALPPLLQVPLAGGDRYLAANIEVFRAMMVEAEGHNPAMYRVLAQVQAGASVLNPAHEDNYYIAQAILPWSGEVDANQMIQERAVASRPWDFLPAFFAGFNRFHFYQDPVAGARFLMQAAERNPENRDSLKGIAAKWYERGSDPQIAIDVIQSMQASTRSQALKQQLEQRIQRLRGLIALRKAAGEFRSRNGTPPRKLEDLVAPGLLDRLPQDPMDMGYGLDATGTPMLLKRKPDPAHGPGHP